ncbi:MAG TPA: response regulator, partial [Paracoccus sp. (in: a-proteobacteria)]|nr:response regulator [Paracoccus sp. (in: a-proteobacteria)]
MSAPAESLSAPARVLIVDDDDGNLVALQAVLAGMGHDIVAARSGPEALRAVLRDEFAVILLDVRMPGMDGYETAELIRQRSRSRHVPIIFLSGVDKEAAHQFRGYAAGAVDYVLKPVEPLVLRSKVAVFTQLFEQRQQMRRTAEAERRLLAENLAVRAREAEVARADESRALAGLRRP